jgi:hypothetical protein
VPDRRAVFISNVRGLLTGISQVKNELHCLRPTGVGAVIPVSGCTVKTGNFDAPCRPLGHLAKILHKSGEGAPVSHQQTKKHPAENKNLTKGASVFSRTVADWSAL